MVAAFDYDRFVMRNEGYIPADVQSRIRRSRLVFAGAGIGAASAVCAARLGFENFILVDGDVVEAHNLNRQFYDFADVCRPKVEALKDKILNINPNAKVEAIQAYLDASNTDAIVSRADIVFDTIDFLDLPAILRLHASAKAHGAEIFTALSVGFGALVWYFKASDPISLADIIAGDVEASGGADAATYADVFARFISRLAPYLDGEVVEQVSHVLKLMKEGRPCPASQVAVGSFAIGAMSASMMVDMLAGRPVPAAPQLVVHSFRSYKTTLIDLTQG